MASVKTWFVRKTPAVAQAGGAPLRREQQRLLSPGEKPRDFVGDYDFGPNELSDGDVIRLSAWGRYGGQVSETTFITFLLFFNSTIPAAVRGLRAGNPIAEIVVPARDVPVRYRTWQLSVELYITAERGGGQGVCFVLATVPGVPIIPNINRPVGYTYHAHGVRSRIDLNVVNALELIATGTLQVTLDRATIEYLPNPEKD